MRCGEGFGNCDWETAPDGGVWNGCEIDLSEDEANCGGCGIACAVGDVCVQPGTCVTP